MPETLLFVYGTLRHDQPEHAQYCHGVRAWRPARVRGRLVRIPEGYWLLVVPESLILVPASVDAAADESRRAAIDAPAIAQALLAGGAEAGSWIHGELLTLADAAMAWPPLDAWEGYAPGRGGVYRRCVVPVSVGAATVPAWAYVTTMS